ncbi:hypothetical protein KKD70_04765, partial [Patescibacteria group bacterium]|nr:hypothetical protein [Patescibacteria group bacterium]
MQEENKQEKQNGWGGIRKGQGRPKGSTNRPRISWYVTEKETGELLELAKEKAKEGNTDILKWILEQVLGKARQNVGLDGGEEGTPIMYLPTEIL